MIRQRVIHHLRGAKNFNQIWYNKHAALANLKESMDTTTHFLKKNSHRLVLRADKGSASVIMKKEEYDQKVQVMLRDPSTYQVLEKDPTYSLQDESNALIASMYKKGI